MKKEDILKEIILELKNPSDFSLNFITSRNGIQCYFSQKSLALFYNFSNIEYQNNNDYCSIEFYNFINIIKQCVVDFYTEKKFEDFDNNYGKINLELNKHIKQSAINQITSYTHYIPVTTLGFERIKTLKLEDIEIISVYTWIDSINIKLNECFEEFDYKLYLKNRLLNKEVDIVKEPCHWMIESIFNAIKNVDSIIKVSMKGFDLNYSIKLSNIIAKTTLDSISLFFNSDVFHQQMLISDKSLPIHTHTIIEINGNINLPGISLSSKIQMISAYKAHNLLSKQENQEILKYICKVLYGLNNPSNSKSHPMLSSRWATALDWYAEGMREQNDAIALAKITTALDVLSNGGRYKGILSLLKKLFNKESNDVVLHSCFKPITLEEFVKNIYDYGRSKILHGTNHERLNSFENERKQATEITRLALFKCLCLFGNYSGDDLNFGFGEI